MQRNYQIKHYYFASIALFADGSGSAKLAPKVDDWWEPLDFFPASVADIVVFFSSFEFCILFVPTIIWLGFTGLLLLVSFNKTKFAITLLSGCSADIRM